MKRFWMSIAAASALSACSGGNPFLDGGDPSNPIEPTSPIPAAVASDLDGVTYTPASGGNPARLVVTGVAFTGTPGSVEFTRKPALDQGDYQAFTRQPDANSTHTTAFVRNIGGTQGTIVVSGGLAGYYNGGGNYSRTGTFDRPVANPSNADVRYSGTYIGLTNYDGPGGDLLPGSTADPALTPQQAGEITGDAEIIADFSQNRVKGRIYNRTSNVAAFGGALTNLDIAPADIAADGSFSGKVTQAQQEKGDYGGVFGGPQSDAVAGALFVKDHIDGVDQEEEYGLFVLDKQ